MLKQSKNHRHHWHQAWPCQKPCSRNERKSCNKSSNYVGHAHATTRTSHPHDDRNEDNVSCCICQSSKAHMQRPSTRDPPERSGSLGNSKLRCEAVSEPSVAGSIHRINDRLEWA